MKISTISNHVIVLDLDETLIHSIDNMDILKNLKIFSDPAHLELRQRLYVMTIDDAVDRRGTGVKSQMWGIIRPGLKEFLKFCFEYFKLVIVWTAGTTRYGYAIVNLIFRDIEMPHVILTRPDCEKDRHGGLCKPLVKIIREVPDINKYMSLANVFAIDDRASTFASNSGNGIKIPAYEPSPTLKGITQKDTALLHLIEWFSQPEVISCKDVTRLDKSKIFSRYIREDEILSKYGNNSEEEYKIFYEIEPASYYESNLIAEMENLSIADANDQICGYYRGEMECKSVDPVLIPEYPSWNYTPYLEFPDVPNRDKKKKRRETTRDLRWKKLKEKMSAGFPTITDSGIVVN